MEEVVKLAPFISGGFGALVGAFLSHRFSRRKERIENTMSLFNQWNSNEMLRSRKIAWVYLTQEFVNSPEPFHSLFNDTKKVELETVDAVTRISYYWYSFYIYEQQGVLERDILTKLFRYQHRHWMNVLEPMYKATIEDGSDIPEWCEMFKNKSKLWLGQPTVFAKDHVLTRP